MRSSTARIEAERQRRRKRKRNGNERLRLRSRNRDRNRRTPSAAIAPPASRRPVIDWHRPRNRTRHRTRARARRAPSAAIAQRGRHAVGTERTEKGAQSGSDRHPGCLGGRGVGACSVRARAGRRGQAQEGRRCPLCSLERQVLYKSPAPSPDSRVARSRLGHVW